MKTRVIIDCDPGLDDAMAILFALNSGLFEVLGITTVAGNIGLGPTTKNAKGLVALMGREDVPVLAGSSKEFLRDNIDALFVHADGVSNAISLTSNAPTRTGAVAWQAETLLAHPPGSIDILTLGPMTNIAHLINDHPEAAERIGQIIAMAGTIDEPGNAGPKSEFNVACDPEAAALVLSSGVKTTFIPLDIAAKALADRAFAESLKGSTAGDAAATIIIHYLEHTKPLRRLYDPCVALFAAAPDLFEVKPMRLVVDLGEGAEAGTLTQQDAGSPVNVAMRADIPACLRLFAKGFQ